VVSVDGTAAVSPGLYWIRLTREGRALIARGAILR